LAAGRRPVCRLEHHLALRGAPPGAPLRTHFAREQRLELDRRSAIPHGYAACDPTERGFEPKEGSNLFAEAASFLLFVAAS